MSAEHMSAERMSVEQMSAEQMSAEQLPAEQMSRSICRVAIVAYFGAKVGGAYVMSPFNNIGFSRLHKIQQQTPKWLLLSLREKCNGQQIEYALTRRASETIQKLSLLTPSPKFGSSYLHYFFSDIFFIALKIHETFYM